MDKSVCQKISKAVPFLRTPQSRDARPYLAKPYQHAVDILNLLEGSEPIDGSTMAQVLKLHRNTVYAVIGALKAGGYRITETVDGVSKKLRGERADVL